VRLRNNHTLASFQYRITVSLYENTMTHSQQDDRRDSVGLTVSIAHAQTGGDVIKAKSEIINQARRLRQTARELQ